MGKAHLPLIDIPNFGPNRYENNGRLLRRPQRRKLEPLRSCISPPDTPEPDEEVEQYESETVTEGKRVPSAVSEDPSNFIAFTPKGPAPTESPMSPTKSYSHLLRTSYELPSQLASIEDIPEITLNIAQSQGNSRSHPISSLSSKKLLRATIHSGPDPLPPPEPRRTRSVIPFEMAAEKGPSEQAYMKGLAVGTQAQNDRALSISRFCSDVAHRLAVPLESVETMMFSRANVRRLTEMIHEKLTTEGNRKHGKVSHTNLNQLIPDEVKQRASYNMASMPSSNTDLPYRPSSHAVTGSRVPQQQILIQMASMLTEQIQATMEGRNIRALIRPFPKWNPNRPIDEMPQAEIVLYEQPTPAVGDDSTQLVVRGEGSAVSGVIMRQTTEKYFMDSKRNPSPFEYNGENGLDTTDIAVLDALVSGGTVLSLKAHFIDVLPDISPMTATLRYLNLSFNNLQNIPPEVLLLHNLEVLKLRNNPIRDIPDEIRHLRCLRTFEIPFCLIFAIPDGLYTLRQLQYLDLSYNKLSTLPSQVKKLKSLQVLFVEGNQLLSLPCACLALHHLRYIRVRNNFMHPIFWPESTKDNHVPQRLADLAGLYIKQFDIDKRYGDSLPEQARQFLAQTRECDCCHGPLVGEGLTLIRPGSIFGVRNVPFMFKSCSHYCASVFMKNSSRLTDYVFSEADHTSETEE